MTIIIGWPFFRMCLQSGQYRPPDAIGALDINNVNGLSPGFSKRWRQDFGM